MCGSTLPKTYPSVHCWICLREIWEKEHSRYYIKNPKSDYLWEEVQAIRGLCPHDKDNEPIIKKAMEEEKINY